jgi:hypothetical protein
MACNIGSNPIIKDLFHLAINAKARAKFKVFSLNF